MVHLTCYLLNIVPYYVLYWYFSAYLTTVHHIVLHIIVSRDFSGQSAPYSNCSQCTREKAVFCLACWRVGELVALGLRLPCSSRGWGSILPPGRCAQGVHVIACVKNLKWHVRLLSVFLAVSHYILCYVLVCFTDACPSPVNPDYFVPFPIIKS